LGRGDECETATTCCETHSTASGRGSNAKVVRQELQIQHFYKADLAYGTGVAKGLGLNVEARAAEGVPAD